MIELIFGFIVGGIVGYFLGWNAAVDKCAEVVTQKLREKGFK